MKDLTKLREAVESVEVAGEAILAELKALFPRAVIPEDERDEDDTDEPVPSEQEAKLTQLQNGRACDFDDLNTAELLGVVDDLEERAFYLE